MPKELEVHARVCTTSQPFQLYSTDSTFRALETSASVGSKSGDVAWLLDFSHADSHGQPLTFATRLLSSGGAVGGLADTGTQALTGGDVRATYRITKQWSAAVGIDNLNNYQYWNFHPYPQRSCSGGAEVRPVSLRPVKQCARARADRRPSRHRRRGASCRGATRLRR